jgi:peptide/nickel transport system ATP-binding protein/oligopeptide transport system ATP-binding protein
LIEVKNLSKAYSSGLIRKNPKKVVRNVSFLMKPGETIGIIGESGCGKTTLAKMILRLIPPTSGQILLGGRDITKLKYNQLKPYRTKMQIMFQNPESSLNPRMKMYHCIAEVLRIHRMVKKNSLDEKSRVLKLAEQVGLQAEHLSRYPFELSGGQVQRAVLSRVLALKPDLLVADEPTSMLDVSVQAQILTMLKSLQRQINFAMLFIAHDLDVIKIMCDRVFVMYLGSIVEGGSADHIFYHARHPYTLSLLNEFYHLSRNNFSGSAVVA